MIRSIMSGWENVVKVSALLTASYMEIKTAKVNCNVLKLMAKKAHGRFVIMILGLLMSGDNS